MARLELVDSATSRTRAAETRRAESNAKRQAIRLVEDLPDDSTFDDVLRELASYRMILRGLADADEGRLLPHAEVLKRSRTWIR